MQMMAVLLLDTSTMPGGYSFERLRTFLQGRIHVVPPLFRRVMGVPGSIHRPAWIDAETIDWDYHLPRTLVAERLELPYLGRVAGELAAEHLDLSRPLWRLRVIEGPTSTEVALLATVHHALMDGLGGMEFMASLFELEPGDHEAVGRLPMTNRPAAPSSMGLLRQAIRDLSLLPADAARLLVQGVRVVSDYVSRAAMDSERAPLPFTAPRTLLNGRLSPKRAVALERISFGSVKDAARVADVTVNDVVLAVVSGALRQYLRRRDACPVTRLVAGVPVATDGPGDGFGNALTYLLVRLPTEVDDPIERLRIASRESSISKRRGKSLGMQTVSSVLDVLTPLPIDVALSAYRNILVDRLRPLWNVFVSNVPGTPVPLYVAGARLDALFPIGPVYDGFGLNITVISHLDELDIGVVSCSDLVGDVEELATEIIEGFTDLCEALQIAPVFP
jgi:diacylglycerol O-acyltransferase